jgi:GNAT superfamily N-acetyltransferase
MPVNAPSAYAARVVVELREVTAENRATVMSLRVAADQEQFVSTVAESLGEAAELPEARPWFRAIYDGDVPVGFVMLSWNVEPDPPRIIGPWFLWKLLIDADRQRQGYGTETIGQVVDLIRAHGATNLLTSYTEGLGEPGPFYRRLGFEPTGERDEDGEVILTLDLGALPVAGNADADRR